MKTIGLLGGMSWESTQVYYRELNRQINQRLGGLHSAQMLMYNVDFAPLEALMVNNQWQQIAQQLTQYALQIQHAGADFLAIATNTMHKVAPQIIAAIDIPLLHIADTVGQQLKQQKMTTVGLLGTAFTMEQAFYKDYLLKHHNIQVVIPGTTARDDINRIIFSELCQGKFTQHSKQTYLQVIDQLAQKGAQGIILGCTEIGLLVNQQDTHVPLVDATECHIQAIVNQSLINTP